MDSFTNETDAELGSETETDSELKSRRDGELQIAGSATIEAILSELRARPLVEAVIVFQNNSEITDADGRPPGSLDIVVKGDDEDDLGEAIFLVVGGGIKMVGDITKNPVDSQGFTQTVRFSRPTGVNIWIEWDLTVNSLYPSDGDDQVEQATLDYGLTLDVGEDVRVYGSDALICAINDIPGIIRAELKIGTSANPTQDNNISISPREIGVFDSARIEVNQI